MEASDRRTYVDFAYTSTDDVFGKSLQMHPWGRSRRLCRPYRWKLARKRQVQIEIPENHVRTDWRGAEQLWGRQRGGSTRLARCAARHLDRGMLGEGTGRGWESRLLTLPAPGPASRCILLFSPGSHPCCCFSTSFLLAKWPDWVPSTFLCKHFPLGQRSHNCCFT